MTHYAPRHHSRAPRVISWLLCILIGAVIVTMLAIWPHRAASAPQTSRPTVLAATLTGDIDPVQAEWVKRVLHRAASDNYDLVVFEMDTPGGLSTSMKDIQQAFLKSKVPVAVYVYPPGSRAASAGTFITMASDVAAMAPQTNIGSATPIQSNGSNVGSDLRRKVVNDAVANITGIAKAHHRNATFAKEAVTKARNLSVDDAVKDHVVEFKAGSLAGLLRQLDGYTTIPKGIVLHTHDATVTHTSMPWTLRLFQALINANTLYLLFIVGMMGLGFEIIHPGFVAPGVIGALCLIIALFGTEILPVSGTGIALIVLAMVLFATEAVVQAHGILGIGGAISLVLGGILLFNSSSGMHVSWEMLATTSIVCLLFFGIVATKAVAARRAPVVTGIEGVVGKTAVIRAPFSPTGMVLVRGELWNARRSEGDDTDLAVGDAVTVLAREGMTLIVDRAPEMAGPGPVKQGNFSDSPNNEASPNESV